MTGFQNRNHPASSVQTPSSSSAPLSGVTAFLLAGGRGKRLLPLTSHRPKPLLPLSGVPLLCRLLLQLDALGCPRAVVTAGYLADTLRQGVEDWMRGSGQSLRLSVDFVTETSPLGTAGGVKAAYNTLFAPKRSTPEKENISISESRPFRSVPYGNISTEDIPSGNIFSGNIPSEDLPSDAASTSGNTSPATPPHTFLILGGDAFLENEQELANALALHLRKSAAMTVLLSRSDSPTEFGLATLDENGTLIAFREKPSWAQVDGNLVSTGIYFVQEKIFDKIPPGKYDFGYDLLHRLLTDRESLCGFPLSSFWCDIGTPAAYLQCQMRLTGGASFHEGASLSEGVRLRGSLLLPGVRMGRGASAEGAVLDEGCTVGPGAHLGEGCVLGRSCHIGKDAVLPPGTVLPEGSIWTDVPAASPGDAHTARRHGKNPGTVPGACGVPDGFFGDNRLVFSPKKGSTDPAFTLRLGRALASACESFRETVGARHGHGGPGETPLRIAVGSDDGASPVRELLLTGIAEGGVEACDLGEVTAGAAAYLARRLRFPLTLFLRYAGDGEFHGLLFDENRLYPGVPLERPLRERLSSGASIPPTDAAHAGKRIRLRPGMRLYTEALADLLPPLDGRRITVSGEERQPLSAALRMRGALVREAEEPPAERSSRDGGSDGGGRQTPSPEAPARLFLHLSEGGGRLTVLDAEKLLSPWQVIALCAGDAMRRGAGVISLPDSAPEALKTMVRRGGCLRCFSHTCADARESAARNLAGEEDYLTDGSFAAARLLRLLTDASLTLREAAALLPVFSFAEEETEVSEKKKASLLAAFATGMGRDVFPDEEFRLLPSYDGVLLLGKSGCSLRAAARNGTRLCLTAEAGDDADAASLLKRAKAFFKEK